MIRGLPLPPAMLARSAPALGADAIDSLEFGGSVLDHGETSAPTARPASREDRPNALDQAAAEYRSIPSAVVAAPSSWGSP